MRVCLAATLLSLLPTIALAAEEAPAASNAPAAAKAAAAAEPSAAAKADEKREPRKAAVDPGLSTTATAFYRALAAHDVEALTALSKPPFYFESKVAASADDIRRKWSESLQGRPLPEVTLYDVELLAFEEMVAKYGKPPEKLASWPTKGAMISIGNVDGHAVVVLWRKSGALWQAGAIHD